MEQKNDEVAWDTCLQITETGKKRLKRIEQSYVLQTIMKQLPVGSAVYSILKRMDNGDTMTVKQLIDLQDKEAKLEVNVLTTPGAMFAKDKISNRLFSRAIKRCIRKGYLTESFALRS
jgi:uncharacterized protein YaiI (UPF0178 family)